MTDFVLLHGTTQSAVGWQRLVAVLEARGHAVRAVELASSSEEPASLPGALGG